MYLDDVTMTLFAACNGIRVLGYLPQIWKAATDSNGASAVSRMTWALFLLAHLSTIAYALVNRQDVWLAVCFAGNAMGCLAILGVAWWKGNRQSRMDSPSQLCLIRRDIAVPGKHLVDCP
jgi:hypothetical protein